MLVWTFVYMFLCGHIFSFLLGIDWGVELLGHMVTLCLTFWGTARLFSKVAAWFYILTSSVWGFHFLHILANTCDYLLFWLQPSMWVRNRISTWFFFAFPWRIMMLIIFSHAYWPFVYLLWKNACEDPLPFFFLAVPCSMWDLSSTTRDRICTPCIGSVESWPLDLQGSPFFVNF